MNPERFAEIERVCQAVLDRAPEKREAFLTQACGGDVDLRREVESLLAARDVADPLISAPPSVESAPPLTAGTRLGPYEIRSFVGAGGMGQVYKGRDTRLGRTVAIKVLPVHLASDPERRRRFENEARAVSALNHPNICTLHDIGSDGGIDYLVMEFVEGQTVGARLRKGPIPLAQALEYGAQIADALSAAHRQGIIHRDLKPANVMLTKSGVKLLDFGLAKLRATAPAVPGMSTSTREVVPDEPATKAGSVLGTIPYMAPEQLQGKESDARSDLFAFGAVLYEMLGGKRAFEGQSSASVAAAVLEHDPPPVSSLQAAAPTALDRLVRKCLAKDPDCRWQSAADVADELKWLLAGSRPAGAAETARARDSRPVPVGRLFAVGLVTITLGAILGSAWLLTRSRVPPPGVRHTQLTFSGNVQDAVLSRDGSTIAYVTSGQPDDFRLWVRDLAGGQPLEIWRGHEIGELVWSPDGTHVIITGTERAGARNDIWLVPRFGGPARRVDTQERGGWQVAVSPDGARIATAFVNERQLRIVPVDGGPVREIKLAGFPWRSPRWSPDPAVIAAVTADSTKSTNQIWEVWLVSPTGRQPQRLYASNAGLSACWSGDPSVLYLEREQNETVDLLRLPITGTRSPDVLLTGITSTGDCTISADGDKLLHTRTNESANLWRFDLHGSVVDAIPLTNGTSFYEFPHVSPDGRWLSVTMGNGVRSTGPDRFVAKMPVSGLGQPIRMTNGANGSWSPDGTHFAFASSQSGKFHVRIGDGDGQQAVELGDSELDVRSVRWLPDGRLGWGNYAGSRFYVYDPKTRTGDWLPGNCVGALPVFSPALDSVAVAGTRKPAGSLIRGTRVLSWPGCVERLFVDDVSRVDWSADGRWLYGFNRKSELVRVAFPSGKPVEVIGRFPADHVGRAGSLYGGCDLTPDRQAMICGLVEDKADVWLVEHFDPKAARRSP